MPTGLKINANTEGKWSEHLDENEDDESFESEDEDNSSEDSLEIEYINYENMSHDEIGEINCNLGNYYNQLTNKEHAIEVINDERSEDYPFDN